MGTAACVASFHPFNECPILGCMDTARNIAPCPAGTRPMYRPDGQPRKCLPHQNSLCVNALPDQPNAATVCCWHNQVDYFCCLDVTPLDCPDYHNVTVVVHNAYPHNPFALRSFHFREGIEDEIAAMTQELIRDNKPRNENGVLIKHKSMKTWSN
ncbi:Kunitz/Bovine pancreatic trypsin inhibitor [Dirofilaria immitis]|nr:Kunitz/Bovine pancreatic trypsin inhibitor [Dirofilaria immitis]